MIIKIPQWIFNLFGTAKPTLGQQIDAFISKMAFAGARKISYVMVDFYPNGQPEHIKAEFSCLDVFALRDYILDELHHSVIHMTIVDQYTATVTILTKEGKQANDAARVHRSEDQTTPGPRGQ